MSRVDYQAISYQDSAPITELGIYTLNPLSLDIRGKEFRAVSQVLINGVPSPEFMTISSTRVVAEVPQSEKDSPLRRVQVLLSRKNLTDTSILSFRANVPGGGASGFTRMLQTFLKILFTNPGDDFHNRDLGGGMGQLIGTPGDPGQLRAAASAAVSQAESQMIRLQAGSRSLQPSETLRTASVLSAKFNPSTSSLQLQLRLTAVDGSTGSPVVSV